MCLSITTKIKVFKIDINAKSTNTVQHFKDMFNVRAYLGIRLRTVNDNIAISLKFSAVFLQFKNSKTKIIYPSKIGNEIYVC